MISTLRTLSRRGGLGLTLLALLAVSCTANGPEETPQPPSPTPTSTRQPLPRTPTPTPVLIDLRQELRAETFTGVKSPYALAFDGEHIWVSHFTEGAVSKMTQGGEVVQTIEVGKEPRALAFAGGYIWVGNGGESTVSKIEPRTGVVVATYVVGGGFTAPIAIEYDGESLWVATSWGNAVFQMTLEGRILRQIPVRGAHPSPWAVVHDGADLWVASLNLPEVQKFDVDGTLVGRYRVGPVPDIQADTGGRGGMGPDALVFDGENVWVAVNWLNKLVKFSRSGENLGEVAVGAWPYYLAFDGESIWSADFGADTVSRVDMDMRRVGTFPVGTEPSGLLYAKGALWVANLRDHSLTKIFVQED